MKPATPLEVAITSMTADGCGCSADGSYRVFGALPGETVIATAMARKHKKLFLRAQEVINPSPSRVRPACAAAAVCGGCSFQHLAHARQLQSRGEWLARHLYPLVPEEWLPAIVGRPYRYRSRARLGVRYVSKKGRVLVGFREKLKPYIADTPSCPVLAEPGPTLLRPLADLIGGLSRPGSLPQVEFAAGDEGAALVFRHLEPMTALDLDKLRDFGERHGLMLFLQPGGLDTIRRFYPESGEDLLRYRLPDFDLDFCFSVRDFTQVNLAVNRQMVSRAVALLAPSPADRVLDAFCGIGNFSLAIARRAGCVTGLDVSAAGIDRARQNARMNGIENASFDVAGLDKPLPVKALSGINKVLLDPPRSGAESLMKMLASMDVERLVYVSCNPETLARDLRILARQGFRLRSAGIIDMFPHTTHMESVSLLLRRESSA